MKTSLSRLLPAAVAAFALGFPAPGHAQTAATDPVGFITIALPADSDTFVSVPLKRPQEYAGLANGVPTKNAGYDPGEPFVDANTNGVYDSGETFTDTFNTITVQGTPGWSANQFVYAGSTQPKHYYVFIAGGTKEGCFYTIVSNTPNSVTVDLAGDDISSAVSGGASATKLQIIPYDTLGTIFPGGQGIQASTTHGTGQRQTEIFIPDQQSTGTNLPPTKSYYYYSGSPVGWRKAGFSGVVADDDILYPDSFFIVRMKPGTNSSLTIMGGVQMNSLQLPVSLFAANTSQDNAVALPIASSLTLRQTNLYESGAFAGSSSHGTGLRKDELFVFDNAVIGHNKPAARSYYYYTGTSPGWRLAGDTVTVRDDTDYVVTSTTALVIRKKSTGTAGTTFWKVKPPYVP